MKNAYKFREVFGLYATELWVMSEKDFLEWLNAEADTPQTDVWEYKGADVGWQKVDTPQTEVGYCNECKWFRDKQVCGRCRSLNLFAKADTPQTEEEINNLPWTDCGWK